MCTYMAYRCPVHYSVKLEKKNNSEQRISKNEHTNVLDFIDSRGSSTGQTIHSWFVYVQPHSEMHILFYSKEETLNINILKVSRIPNGNMKQFSKNNEKKLMLKQTGKVYVESTKYVSTLRLG